MTIPFLRCIGLDPLKALAFWCLAPIQGWAAPALNPGEANLVAGADPVAAPPIAAALCAAGGVPRMTGLDDAAGGEGPSLITMLECGVRKQNLQNYFRSQEWILLTCCYVFTF